MKMQITQICPKCGNNKSIIGTCEKCNIDELDNDEMVKIIMEKIIKEYTEYYFEKEGYSIQNIKVKDRGKNTEIKFTIEL